MSSRVYIVNKGLFTRLCEKHQQNSIVWQKSGENKCNSLHYCWTLFTHAMDLTLYIILSITDINNEVHNSAVHAFSCNLWCEQTDRYENRVCSWAFILNNIICLVCMNVCKKSIIVTKYYEHRRRGNLTGVQHWFPKQISVTNFNEHWRRGITDAH